MSLPRPVFEQLIAREDGLATLERIQRQASEARTFDGVPHLVVIFIGVLLFFWSAMFYSQRKHARVHRTIQLMVEKGMPVPPELLRSDEAPAAGTEGAVGPALAPPVWAGMNETDEIERRLRAEALQPCDAEFTQRVLAALPRQPRVYRDMQQGFVSRRAVGLHWHCWWRVCAGIRRIPGTSRA